MSDTYGAIGETIKTEHTYALIFILSLKTTLGAGWNFVMERGSY
jgi:hypothetical protein